MKKRTTITLSEETIKDAKSLRINISGFSDRKLKEEINRIKRESKKSVRKIRRGYAK